ncbi:MAG: serine/threonine protein kinase [Deltaproteobacteria bacterium]|nr:serine/threonine protein kinase [Deltaproteobacteria bacterium]
METFGPWQLEALIAVGGLGEIWRARRLGLPDAVALKRLHTHLARNDEGLAQFTLEQRLATTLPRHVNVVHATEAGDVDGRPYVAMELAPGEDLRRIVAPPATKAVAHPPPVMLTRARTLAIVEAACHASAHLHAHGWVHGDINPSNLIVDDSDHVTLIDLGIARAIGEAGAVRGTHAYMAPEQVRGEPWTEATDVFALGVVLWELVTGTRLFHRGPPWLSMAAVVEAPAPPIADAALDTVVQAALHKDPAQRPRSPTELASRLRST